MMLEGVSNNHQRLVRVLFSLGVAVVLTGCNGEGVKALAEVFAGIMLVLLVAALIGAVLSLIWLALQITVIVVNFTRPRPWSMVAGYVLAALQGLGTVGASLTMLSGVEGAEITTDQIIGAVGGMVVGLGTSAILAGSSYWAQQKLKPPKLEDPPY